MGGTGPAAIRRGARRPCPLREEGGCARALDARRVPHGGGAAARDGPSRPRRGGPPRAGAVGDGEARAAARPRPGDPYVQGLQALVRQPARERLLDRLLVSALIEARSEERLALLGANLPDPEMKRFYSRLADAESGHRELFLRLARRCEGFEARLGQMLRAEASLIRELPLRPAIH